MQRPVPPTVAVLPPPPLLTAGHRGGTQTLAGAIPARGLFYGV